MPDQDRSRSRGVGGLCAGEEGLPYADGTPGGVEENRFHCLFVKTLAYLTDVGPDDGGTCLIPGSHRMYWRREEMIQAVMDDERSELKDIIEHPERYDMPCLVPQGVRVDHVVGRGAVFEGRGFRCL